MTDETPIYTALLAEHATADELTVSDRLLAEYGSTDENPTTEAAVAAEPDEPVAPPASQSPANPGGGT